MTDIPPERAITNLVHALAEAIDDADGDRIEALFGDGTFTMAGGRPREGGAAFRQVIEQGMLTYDGSPRTAHQVTNLTIEVDPGGRSASGEARITVYQQVPATGDRAAFPLQAVLVGRYQDRYHRDADGTWRFTSRVMHVDLVGDTSRHSRHRL
jgi:hypothetical protein